ncbi:MAG TPA: hypothetical protein VFJ74_15520 [Gemmatimonadaceae bacterium]|nr:hypothetical protein [Gemmatimonadaceae bacterium]
MTQLDRPLAIILLAGTVLLAAAAPFHPMLVSDAAANLRIIASTPYWRTLHLIMLATSGLVIVGIWVRALPTSGTGGGTPMLIVLAIIALGLTVNALDTGFMAGAGWRMASLYRDGHPEMSALFETTWPIGRIAARFGNFLVAIGALLLGWLEWHDASSPRWLAWLAWLAGVGGLVGALFFREESMAALGAVALLSGWQVAVAVRALRRRPVALPQRPR